jgi:hypothetical protein
MLKEKRCTMGISKKRVKSSSRPNKKAPEFDMPTIEKQMLCDLEKRISLHVGNFLVLTEEGEPTQIALAHQKAKSELLKFGPEMNKIATHLGGTLPNAVQDFLESMDSVLHASMGWIDDELLSLCFHTTQKLQSELKNT